MPHFDQVSFAIRPGSAGAWDVHARIELADASAGDGDLLMLTPGCPLELRSVDVSWSRERVLPNESERASVLRLPPCDFKGKRGKRGALGLVLQWKPDGATDAPAPGSATRWRAPCLVLPDMLPRVVAEAALLETEPPLRQTRVFYSEQLPEGLSAGGVSVPDWRGRATPELLQAVVFPTGEGMPDYDDLAVAAPIVDRARRSDVAAYEAAYEYLAPLRAFVSRELMADLPVRPVMYLADVPAGDVFPPMGAFCPLASRDAGMERARVGKPVGAILLLAQAWLGAGIRIWGDNGVELSLAMGGALGLRWLEAVGEHDHLEQTIERLRAAPGSDGDAARGSIAAIARELQLPVYEGLRSNGLRRELGRMIRKRWGKFVKQDEVIALLRRFGVEVPGVFA